MKTFESVKNSTNRVVSSFPADTGGASLSTPFAAGKKNPHPASHKRPSTPMAIKALCQPCHSTSQAMMGVEMTAPMDAPLLKMPEASARSFAGNHSLTSLAAAGQLPASPAPRRNRKHPSESGPRAKTCSIPASDHQSMQQAYPR